MVARGIHHLGVAVEDLDEALETYARLFDAELEHRALVEDQGVEAAAVLVGSGRVELLAPLGEETPVGKFLASRGPGMHHVAYEVGDLRSELGRLSAAECCSAGLTTSESPSRTSTPPWSSTLAISTCASSTARP